jgi:hypothetical protein
MIDISFFIIWAVFLLILFGITYITWATDLGRSTHFVNYFFIIEAIGTIVFFLYPLRMYKELYGDIPELQKIQDPPEFDPTSPKYDPKEDAKRIMYEISSALIIFGDIAGAYNSLNAISSDWKDDPFLTVWVHRWESWFQSTLLRHYWNRLKTHYTPMTQKFIDDYIIPQSIVYIQYERPALLTPAEGTPIAGANPTVSESAAIARVTGERGKMMIMNTVANKTPSSLSKNSSPNVHPASRRS